MLSERHGFLTMLSMKCKMKLALGTASAIRGACFFTMLYMKCKMKFALGTASAIREA